jgi:hypothetical protein
MRKIMNLLGVGPKLVLFTLLYSFLLKTGIGHYHFDFTLKILPLNFLVIVGTFMDSIRSIVFNSIFYSNK